MASKNLIVFMVVVVFYLNLRTDFTSVQAFSFYRNRDCSENGEWCYTHEECCNRNCRMVCRQCLPDDWWCDDDAECCSGFCNDNNCVSATFNL
ncbi:unnamed protein product [Allacma fusca]|uniref:Uncharacterized protein n=1 Tax=Allacma fusca TaxID=39272 RepID=A0A8J2LUD6_9HEXA|nr:unnamed protein product [Allacma fusca]CAG7838420.1 unnamed protein product [Allacma fusca]